MLRTQLARSLRAASARPLAARAFHATPAPRLQNLFEAPENPPLSVHKLTAKGFILSDGLVVPGGAIFAEGKVFLWDVDPPKGDGSQGLAKAWEGWGVDRFAVFERLVPRPEILLFGTGARVIPAPPEIRDYISSLGIQLDLMDTRNAASTYNLLFEEGRTVSAALCPLTPVDPRTGGPRAPTA
ncbi:mitochondrial import receptor subunit tom20 [Vanrija albida]|uniref:Mitochondrial import receptor subunit tom20 n=1 Tax=Vanrija albida TaxID=181172 RepID=A0ABR3PVU5_9TREE